MVAPLLFGHQLLASFLTPAPDSSCLFRHVSAARSANDLLLNKRNTPGPQRHRTGDMESNSSANRCRQGGVGPTRRCISIVFSFFSPLLKAQVDRAGERRRRHASSASTLWVLAAHWQPPWQPYNVERRRWRTVGPFYSCRGVGGIEEFSRDVAFSTTQIE